MISAAILGKYACPSIWVIPMSRLAQKAPVKLPRPPTTTMISVRIRISKSRPEYTPRIGVPMKPANPASARPATKTPPKMAVMLKPRDETISLLEAPARGVAHARRPRGREPGNEAPAENGGDVEAQRRHHLLVGDPCADYRTDPRPLEHQVQPDRQQEPDHYDHQPVARDRNAEEPDRARKEARRVERLYGAPEDPVGDVLDHERQPEGQQYLVEVIPAVHGPEDGQLRDEPQTGDYRDGDEQGEPEAQVVDQGDADKAGEHKERSMGEVDHVHHPEDQGQPRR